MRRQEGYGMGSKIFSIFSLGALALAGASRSDDWPAYRGPLADGVVREVALPGDGAPQLGVTWSSKLGSGYSSVTVADGRALTMFSSGESDYLIALDAEDGSELWRLELGPTYRGHDGSHTGPMSTPLIDGDRVFALGPWGRLLAASVEDGTVLWSTDLQEESGAQKPHYGFSTAPLLIGDTLVVQIGAPEGAAIAGFDAATGERRWAAGDDSIAHQSPVPFVVGGRTLVMAVGGKKLMAIDPKAGSQLWEYEHGGAGARGVLSLMPVLAGEGRVFLAHRDNASKVVQIGHDEEGKPTFETLWENNAIRNSYNVPVYHDGHLYAFSSRFLTCVDAATGETRWKSRKPGDGFLMIVDGYLVIQTKNGSLHVAPASPDGYEELGSVELFSELAWAPPSFANGSVYVRSLGEVARVDVSRGEEPSMMAAAGQGARADLAGSAFGAFLEEVALAADKEAVVERFLGEQASFPIIEGDDLVHFVYAGEQDDLAIGGDMVGSRQEAPMTRVEGTDLHYYSTRLEPDARVSYVFIRDYEEVTDPRNPNSHKSSIYGPDMELVFSPERTIEMSWVAMPHWKAPQHLGEPAADRRGSIEEHELSVEGMEQPLQLAVHLPRGYAESGDHRYPVLYVTGGTGARQQGGFEATLENLAGASMEPAIAVFIDAALPPPMMGQLGGIMAEQVVPLIDSTYRTRTERDDRAVVGAGFAGYGAMFAAFSQPAVFGRLGAVSPTMLDSMRVPLEAVIPQASDQPIEIYLAWSRYGLRNPHENWNMAHTIRNLDALLRTHGYEPEGGEAHDGAGWSSWRNRTDDMLVMLFPASAE
jgi:outer membrane protein assembly factor BamB/enterochelin esterase-like enzyme